jgi:hypothetical protein
MSKLRVQLTSNYAVDVSIKWWQDLKQRNVNFLMRWLGWLGVAAAGLIPLIIWWQQVNTVSSELESVGLYTFLVGIGALVAVMLAWTVFNRWQHYVDPVLFMVVLFFALISIGIFLINVNGQQPVYTANAVSQYNTFGAANMKFVAGVFIMAAVAAYYSLNVLLNTPRKLQLTQGVTYLALLIPLAWFLFGNALPYWQPLVAVVMPVAWLLLVLATKRWAKLLGLVGVLISAIVLWQQTQVWQYWAVLVVWACVWNYIYAFSQNWQITSPFRLFISDIQHTVDGKLKINEFTRKHLFGISLYTLLILTVMAIVWTVTNKVQIAATTQSIVEQLQAIWADLSGNTNTVLFGAGTNPTLYYSTTFLNILQISGLVGIAMYVLLSLAAIWLAIKQIFAYFQGRQRLGVIILTPVVMAVPLLGLLGNLNLYLAVMWWWSTSLMTASLLWPRQRKLFTEWTKWQVGTRNLTKFIPLVQILWVVAVVALLVLYWHSLNGLFAANII